MSALPDPSKSESVKKNARIMLRQPGNTLGPLRLNAGIGGFFSADVQDVSVLGIGLIVDQEYPAGSSFVIEDGPTGRKPSVVLTVEVRHATLQTDGRWLLGCVFSRLLTLDDVEALG
jgi:hypothetical protein